MPLHFYCIWLLHVLSNLATNQTLHIHIYVLDTRKITLHPTQPTIPLLFVSSCLSTQSPHTRLDGLHVTMRSSDGSSLEKYRKTDTRGMGRGKNYKSQTEMDNSDSRGMLWDFIWPEWREIEKDHMLAILLWLCQEAQQLQRALIPPHSQKIQKWPRYKQMELNRFTYVYAHIMHLTCLRYSRASVKLAVQVIWKSSVLRF